MVYRTLSRTQKQLHKDYHSDLFLRDHLVISANLPQLERSFKDKAARTTQEFAQRIAALLSSDTGSSGSQRGYSAEYEIDEINYGLGRRFEGDARKKFPSKVKVIEFPGKAQGNVDAGSAKKIISRVNTIQRRK
jgi:hypothetical protein